MNQQQQPQTQPRETVKLTDKYGTFELRIIGDPQKLLDDALAYFEIKQRYPKPPTNS